MNALMLASIAAIAVVISWYGITQLFERSKAKAEQSDEGSALQEPDSTSAPDLHPFSNPITFGLLVICVSFILIGLIMIVSQNSWGIGVGMIGVVIWWAGYTKHSVDPRFAGALTFWGSYIKIGGKPVVVGGDTILAPYWPFNLRSTQFDMTDVDHDFDVTIYTKDNVPMKGVVSVTFRPDIEDAVDYIQTGKMENIIKLVDEIVIRDTKQTGKDKDSEDVAKNPALISKPLQDGLPEVFERKHFGVEVIKIQANFEMPDDIQNAMRGVRRELYERQNETTEYDTDIKAAEILLAKYRKEGDNKVTLRECLKEVMKLRLIRDEKVVVVDSSGGGNLSIIDPKFDFGSGKKGK